MSAPTPARELREEEARILSGPITPCLIRLALPVLASMLLHTLFNVVDAFWVGRLGPSALAGVTTSMFATWMLLGAAEMIATGIVAVASRHRGAGEFARADLASAQGLVLATLLPVLLAVPGAALTPALFDLLGVAEDVRAHGIAFLRPLVLLALPFFLLVNLEAILRAAGDTKTPLRATLCAVLLNVALDPVFIYGWGPVPAMGVAGAAYATILSESLGAAYLGWHLVRERRHFPHLGRSLRAFRPDEWARLVRIGAPTSFGTVLFSLVYLFMSRVAGQLGTAELALLGLGNRLESLCYLSGQSLSVATSTMVGQNLGARNLPRVWAAVRRAQWLAIALSTAIGLCYLIWGRQMVAVFSPDSRVQALGGLYMATLAVSQPFMGLEIVLQGAFSGAGYTLRPTWINVPMSLARIPLSPLFAIRLGFGLAGLGGVISGTCILRSLGLLWLYRRGRWSQTSL